MTKCVMGWSWVEITLYEAAVQFAVTATALVNGVCAVPHFHADITEKGMAERSDLI